MPLAFGPPAAGGLGGVGVGVGVGVGFDGGVTIGGVTIVPVGLPVGLTATPDEVGAGVAPGVVEPGAMEPWGDDDDPPPPQPEESTTAASTRLAIEDVLIIK